MSRSRWSCLFLFALKMLSGTAGRPSELSWAEERDSQHFHSVCAHCTSLQLPRWKSLKVVSELGEQFLAGIAHTSTHSWHRAWITLPSWEAWECGGSQDQHAGDTWEQQDHSWQLCLAKTYHSSMIQSLGNPLAAIGKAVLKHGNIARHRYFFLIPVNF